MNFDCLNAHNGECGSFSFGSSSTNEYYDHLFHGTNAGFLDGSYYDPHSFAGVFANPTPLDTDTTTSRGLERSNVAYILNGSSASSSTMSSPVMTLNLQAPDHQGLLYGQGADVVGKKSSSSTVTKTNDSTVRVNKKANVVKGQWTAEEDRLLVGLVDKYGSRRWTHIAQMLDGRIGKQCRERWHNHLRPNIKKESWSEEEDRILIQAHSEIGNKWAEIAKHLPGRAENSIKNHWNATKRRQLSRRRCRYPKSAGTLLQSYIKSLSVVAATKAQPAGTSNGPTSVQTRPCPVATSTPAAGCGNSFGQAAATTEVYDVVPQLFEQLGCVPAVGRVQESKWAEMEMEMECWPDEAVPPLITPAMSCENVKKEMDLVEMMSQNYDCVIQNLS